MIWTAPKIWDGGHCWIIGGGNSMPYQFNIPEDVIDGVCTGRLFPDAYSDYMEPLHKQHVIGVNMAYKIGTWMDVVFFGDSGYYLVHRRALAGWPGLKISCHPRFANKRGPAMEGVKFLQRDHKKKHGISNDPHKVCWNGNSGAAAISVAANFGVKQIFLLGFDMMASKFTHWFGQHGNKKKAGPYKRHLQGFPQIGRDAEARGIKIWNVNLQSQINTFPKITLVEALSKCG
jgi:hypothetical protein